MTNRPNTLVKSDSSLQRIRTVRGSNVSDEFASPHTQEVLKDKQSLSGDGRATVNCLSSVDSNMNDSTLLGELGTEPPQLDPQIGMSAPIMDDHETDGDKAECCSIFLEQKLAEGIIENTSILPIKLGEDDFILRPTGEVNDLTPEEVERIICHCILDCTCAVVSVKNLLMNSRNARWLGTLDQHLIESAFARLLEEGLIRQDVQCKKAGLKGYVLVPYYDLDEVCGIDKDRMYLVLVIKNSSIFRKILFYENKSYLKITQCSRNRDVFLFVFRLDDDFLRPHMSVRRESISGPPIIFDHFICMRIGLNSENNVQKLMALLAANNFVDLTVIQGSPTTPVLPLLPINHSKTDQHTRLDGPSTSGLKFGKNTIEIGEEPRSQMKKRYGTRRAVNESSALLPSVLKCMKCGEVMGSGMTYNHMSLPSTRQDQASSILRWQVK
uniref:General transcription factor 3C polypeptide 1 n=1 Tax=Heterorhabditis bacteriophora TaxID=37862 RepID=A0A1I7XFV8_HETBA